MLNFDIDISNFTKLKNKNVNLNINLNISNKQKLDYLRKNKENKNKNQNKNILDLDKMKLNKENNSNTIIENCKEYIKKLEDNNNINKDIYMHNDFTIFISSANSCLIENKYIYLFDYNLEENNKNALNLNFEGNANDFNTDNDSNTFDEKKKTSGRSLGIMISVFLLVIFILMIYMGVLVFQRFFANFFKDKKKRENEDEDRMTLKSNAINKRNKELDNLY